mmetsp:Transcript_7269/g.18087  ORF Transcript_7269/g.18087 Transcript_7269/m.18087 type:complete len:218 (-) Transcript_7269:14-667(-)
MRLWRSTAPTPGTQRRFSQRSRRSRSPRSRGGRIGRRRPRGRRSRRFCPSGRPRFARGTRLVRRRRPSATCQTDRAVLVSQTCRPEPPPPRAPRTDRVVLVGRVSVGGGVLRRRIGLVERYRCLDILTWRVSVGGGVFRRARRVGLIERHRCLGIMVGRVSVGAFRLFRDRVCSLIDQGLLGYSSLPMRLRAVAPRTFRRGGPGQACRGECDCLKRS